MTVLPGSLDYLYYNGVLDHVPYEAYPTPVSPQVGVSGTEYLNMAQGGSLYHTYGGNTDTFVRRNNNPLNNYNIAQHAYGDGMGVGLDVKMRSMANGQTGGSFRQDIIDSANATAVRDEKTKAPTNLGKGLLALGILGVTLIAILKGKKKP